MPPVAANDVPVAAPMFGVTKVGLVANTSAPVPVSSVTAAARFALEGVARKVATPVPKPEMPVATGNPVQLVSVPDVGVPRIGVTSVGLVLITTEPEPVIALLTRFLLASVNTACDAVRFEMLTTPALLIDSLEAEFV